MQLIAKIFQIILQNACTTSLVDVGDAANVRQKSQKLHSLQTFEIYLMLCAPQNVCSVKLISKQKFRIIAYIFQIIFQNCRRTFCLLIFVKKIITKNVDNGLNFLNHPSKCLYYFFVRRGTLRKSGTIVSKISLHAEFSKHKNFKNRCARKIIYK